MDIKSIFYAEFDLNKGAQILFEAPSSFLDQTSTFRTLQNYIIPPKDLCGKVQVMFLTEELSLISLPVELHLPIYLRKSFEFNLGFLVSAECLLANRKKLERILRQVMF